MKKLPKTLSVFHSALKMYHVYVFEAKLTKDLLWVFFHEVERKKISDTRAIQDQTHSLAET